MNSYWAEQQGRQHVDQLVAEARGGHAAHAARASARDDSAADEPGTIPRRRRISRRARGWAVGIVLPSRRHVVGPR